MSEPASNVIPLFPRPEGPAICWELVLELLDQLCTESLRNPDPTLGNVAVLASFCLRREMPYYAPAEEPLSAMLLPPNWVEPETFWLGRELKTVKKVMGLIRFDQHQLSLSLAHFCEQFIQRFNTAIRSDLELFLQDPAQLAPGSRLSEQLLLFDTFTEQPGVPKEPVRVLRMLKGLNRLYALLPVTQSPDNACLWLDYVNTLCLCGAGSLQLMRTRHYAA